jgi:hypothetical protein
MSLFNSTNFERQGNTDNDLHLEKEEDVCKSIITYSASTLRSIKIFTPDLEKPLYDNDDFRQNILNFTRGNRHAQVLILANDLTPAIQQGHQLLRLVQQLTSAIKIKTTSEDYSNMAVSFILFDQSAFIFKTDSSKNIALQSTCKMRSNKLNDFFTLAWELAKEDSQTQQLHI